MTGVGITGAGRRQRMEEVRAALIRAALDGYEGASLSGLCHEGAWEAAISAMRALDLEGVGED
jgi:hypothetical protein